MQDINTLTDKEMVLFELKYEECKEYKKDEERISTGIGEFREDGTYRMGLLEYGLIGILLYMYLNI